MYVRTRPLMLGLLLLTIVSCAKHATDKKGLPGPPPSAPHHGAWFGSGMAFPGERLCLVFCPDGRMFAGDAKCTDTTYAKFQIEWTYTLSAAGVHAESAESAIDFQWQQTGRHAVANIAGISNLPMDQQARTSALCGNAPQPKRPETAEPTLPF
jgi:hypothetical protein